MEDRLENRKIGISVLEAEVSDIRRVTPEMRLMAFRAAVGKISFYVVRDFIDEGIANELIFRALSEELGGSAFVGLVDDLVSEWEQAMERARNAKLY